MNKVAIIDYGIGNILSVKRAFEYWGAEVTFIDQPAQIQQADRIVLPGVGAFKDGMSELARRNLVDAIREYCSIDRPFLGICLGMQMMLTESEEFGYTEGLGLIPGKVTRIEPSDINETAHKIPHVGWNELTPPKSMEDNLWTNTLLDGIPEQRSVYFVHSYTARPSDEQYRLADTYYGGRLISAAIRKGNLYGTQFHPEKSGEIGLKMIRNFLKL